MARKKIIAGNWKMNMTPSEAVELVNTLKPLVVTNRLTCMRKSMYQRWLWSLQKSNVKLFPCKSGMKVWKVII